LAEAPKVAEGQNNLASAEVSISLRSLLISFGPVRLGVSSGVATRALRAWCRVPSVIS
jgi:hypothetical protein